LNKNYILKNVVSFLVFIVTQKNYMPLKLQVRNTTYNMKEIKSFIKQLFHSTKLELIFLKKKLHAYLHIYFSKVPI
jgi:hypothetical protein